MKSHQIFKKLSLLTASAACAMATLLAVPPEVLADDTDVFFPPAAVSSVGTINPNILFVLDDSGSMRTIDSGQTESRLKRVQTAFVTIMNNMAANTNVGLMRFSNTKGGPVIFPVAPIESLIADVHPSFATISQSSTIVAASNSEAEQRVSGGAVTTNQSPIYFGSRSVVDLPVAQEAEQNNSSGTNRTNCTTLGSPSASCNSNVSNPLELIKTSGTLTNTTSHQWVGLRFQQVPLPTDFVATDARLVFTANTNDADPADLKIWGNRNNTAPAFSGTPNWNVAPSTGSGDLGFAPPNGVPCGGLTSCTPSSGGRVPTNGSPATSFTAPYAYSGGASTTSGVVPWLAVPVLDQADIVVSPNVKDLVNEIKNCTATSTTTNYTNTLSGNHPAPRNTFTLTSASPLPPVGAAITLTAGTAETRTVASVNTGTRVVTTTANSSQNHNGGAVNWSVTVVDPNVINPCSSAWQAAPTTSQNVLTFMIGGDNASGKGRRRIESLTNSATVAAKLQIAYTSVASPPPEVTTGLRFENVQIPKGVNITNAYIKFNQDALGGAGVLKLKIRAETNSNPAAYSASANDVTGRSYTGPTAFWTVPAWNTPLGNQDTSATNLAPLLNNVVNQGGWCGGNAVSFKFEVDTGSDPGAFRRAFSSTMSDDNAPTLVYTYSSTDPALETGCTIGSTAIQIGAPGSDDAEERPIGGAVNLAETTLDLGCAGTCSSSTSEIVGLRFPTVSLPANAVIFSAFIDFGANGSSSSGSSTLKFFGQNSGNAPAFTTAAANLKNRRDSNAVAATVTWAPTSWSSNTTYTSPDLKTIVQQIVNRADWANGNAMVFLVDGNGRRQAYSREGRNSAAPKLRINYQTTVGKLTVRNYLKILVNDLTPLSFTPSVGTLYEGARYLRGEAAFYGRTRGYGDTLPADPDADTDTFSKAPDLNVSHPSTFTGTVPAAGHVYPNGCGPDNLTNFDCIEERYTATTVYKTPMTDSCQQTSMVFLTDGLPNNNDAMGRVKAMKGSNACKTVSLDDADGGTCAEELTEFLYTTDQSSLPGVQKVRTFTIGFAFQAAAAWLTDVATKGGGEYFEASSSAELVDVFQAITSQILDVDTTFVAPAVTVNTFNRLTNRNELYFALFKPDITVNWGGNLKRYQLLLNTSGVAEVYDKDGILAVDPATGFFRDTACSFWTTNCDDGAEVSKGGAASKLTTTRNIYTFIGSSPNDVDLTTSVNKITESNSAITKTILGIPSATDTERTDLLKWVRGLDVNDDNGDDSVTDARTGVGDPLHSRPTLISYGGTDANPDLAIFYGDNHGYFHAADASATDANGGGSEYFSFIPEELLDNLNLYYEGGGNHANRPYGMDGPIISYVKDANQNGSVDTGDTALIYAGMRRGGSSYYALNVSDRTKPRLKFQIKGGTNGGLGDYRELGQSWSTPVLAAVRIAGVNRGQGGAAPVLIFTGGYDPAHDAKTDVFSGVTRNGDGQGRAIFVADAETGALLWWAGFKSTGLGTTPNLDLSADMVYSIPSSPQPVDLDGDGLVDRIYVTDSGGQVFRIILGKDGPGGTSGTPSLSNATGSMIAKLSTPGVATSRHFFNSPSVALITERVSKPFLALSIGTGHRERPLEAGTQDRFYVLKDPDITNQSPSALLINGDADLYDASANLAGSADSAVATAAKNAIAAKKGLYINLGASEKSLTDATTFNNRVLFATFKPGVIAGGTSCSVNAGESRFYQINIADGTPASLDGNRSQVVKVAGLAPDPVVLLPSGRIKYNADGSITVINDGTSTEGVAPSPKVCIGAVCLNLEDTNAVKKSYWRQN